MKPIEEIPKPRGDDPGSLSTYAARARDYLLRHKWCRAIRRGFIDDGWPGIVAVFFFEIEPAHDGVDDSLWVIMGDLPPAYICNDNETGKEALEAYLYEMQRWVDAVREGGSVGKLIPVNVPPTIEYADMLTTRLNFIWQSVLPEYGLDSLERDDEADDETDSSAEAGN